MDKKSGRSIQPLSKGTNFDKKNQDSSNGKLWTRGANRRESASGSLSIKSEATRKHPPQRFRSFDKRPKPRGHSDSLARDEASCVEQHEVELGSVLQPGSKKQNLNHLLNFTYAPRIREQRQYGSGSPYGKNGNRVKKQKYVKDHFLQANCQFVVNAYGDYKQYLINPDALVEWKFIEQINVQVNESPSCPICLHTPLAAKITRCGHIYCWSCILHYLSLSDFSQQKCPICYEVIHKQDLKSVIVIPHNTFNVGESITFKLMKRSLNSLTPYPAEEKIAEEKSLKSISDAQATKIYSKLLLAQNSDILSIINRENQELKFQLESEEDSEKCFIEEAILYLNQRETKVLDDLMHNMNLEESSVDKVSSENVDANLALDKEKYIYFYQASDGQHVYIHNFNVRMLKHTYGSLEHAPNTITARILAKEGDSMTENYRKCYKYLAHLPVTCSFDTMEIELKLPVVSQETLDCFKDEIEERKRKRLKKAKEEKRREKRITEEENIKLYNKYPTTVLPLESPLQFPTVSFESVIKGADESSKDVCELTTFSSHQEYSGPSYSKMAATSKTISNPWPNLRSSTTPVASSSSKNCGDLSIARRRRYNSNYSNSDEQENTDHESMPEPRSTFGDAIAQAIENAAHSMKESAYVSENGKKKKKSKQKLLLSTSLSYSGN